MDDTRRTEKIAFESTRTIFAYEIRKKEKEIREWETMAHGDSPEARATRDLIADAKRRIAYLHERWMEIEDRESLFRETRDDVDPL